MQHDLVELARVAEPVPADRDVARRHRLERAAGEVAGEDDVHDVLRRERPLRRDRVDDRDRPLDGQLVLIPALFAQLAVQRVLEALARVDAAAGQKPVLATVLLVAAEQDPVLPAEDGGDADARLHRHQWLELPKPRSPRSLSGSDSTSTGSTPGISMIRSCAMRMPGSTTTVSLASVLWRITFSSPR